MSEMNNVLLIYKNCARLQQISDASGMENDCIGNLLLPRMEVLTVLSKIRTPDKEYLVFFFKSQEKKFNCK